MRSWTAAIRWSLIALTLTLASGGFGAIDTDGDGQSDAEEAAAGTDPNNAQSVQWKNLATWRFTAGTLTGDQGQTPLLTTNVSILTGFDGNGAYFPPTNFAALQFRGIEGSGKANVSIKRGSIRFRLKTFWFSDDGDPNFGGVGPGSWITLVQTTNLALRIDPKGTNLVLTSEGLSGETVTNINVALPPIESSNFRPNPNAPGESFWYDVLLSYSPEGTAVFFGAGQCDIIFTGSGIAELPNAEGRNQFISFGAAADGSGSINAVMDEIATFNAPGVLGTNAWKLSAASATNPVSLNLMWQSATNLILDVKKRVAGSSTWTILPPVLGTNFVDLDVVRGGRYDYLLNSGYFRPAAVETLGSAITGAVEGSPMDAPGKILLLVDKTLTNQINSDLNTFITNLVADGWQVLRGDMPRHIDDNSSPTSYLTNYFYITNVIAPFVRSNYAVHGTSIKHILILGHVTIPYTGTLADDGHNSASDPHGAHQGAWPCDFYYGDMDGNWTDTLNVSNPSYAANSNFAGDGKFDQNYIPANGSGVAEIEVPVSRIDFASLPSFTDSEATLLNKYLKKNVAYRRAQRTFSAESIAQEYLPFSTYTVDKVTAELVSRVSPLKAAQIGDAFAATGSFLFGGHSGPGRFDAVNDALPGLEHSTHDIAVGNTKTNTAFYFLLGSYYPDWNTSDNLLRATLATTNGGLGAAVIMQPRSWQASGFGAGFGIGGNLRDVINNWPPELGRSVRTAEFMGDPTLRYPMPPQPSGLAHTLINNQVYLNWTAPSGSVEGYYIYRSTNGVLGEFQRISATPVASTIFVDTNAPGGSMLYMVRALSRVTTGSGTYTNLSEGIFLPVQLDLANCCIPDVVVNEDVLPAPVTFGLGTSPGENVLFVSPSSSYPTLIPNQNLLLSGSGTTRTLTMTPLTNEFGAAAITILIQTDQRTILKIFEFTVNPVNDPPSFHLAGNTAVVQDAGPQTLYGMASGMSPGPENEETQTLTFLVSTDHPELFAAGPAIDPAGTLTYTPALHARGVALVTVRLKDDGGTAFGGQDTSAAQTFYITIGLATDTDGDGLPDDFEAAFGLDPNSSADASVDSDADGFTNFEEYIAGTSPLDSTSALRITAVAADPAGIRVQASTTAGLSYTLEANDSFPGGTWNVVSSPVLASGALTEITNTGVGTVSNRIYRITTVNRGIPLASEPAGYIRMPMLGSSDTLLSMPFARTPAEYRWVDSFTGNELTVTTNGPAWTAGQWVYSAPSRTNTYYVMICSGSLEGQFYTVTGNSTRSLTLDLQGASLTGLNAGDRIAIVPYWTLGTIFPGGAGVHATPGFIRRTEVLLPNFAGTGINLSAQRTYFFSSGIWKQVGSAGNKNDDVLPPDMFVWVRHNVATNTEVLASGAVLRTKFQIPIRRLNTGSQDNLVALPRPGALTLNQSGLIESGAFRATTGFIRLDELLVFNNSNVAQNKSAAATYFYSNGIWRKLGTVGDRGGDLVFQPGTAVIIRSGAGTSQGVWTNAPGF